MLKAFVSAALIGISLVSIVSCGKEQTESLNPQVDTKEPIKPDPEKQKVFCEKTGACPNFITKIMVVSQGKRRFCTGSLVSTRIVATSTSCLPKALRSPDVSCDENLFFFFEKSSDGTPEMVGCKKVLQVSELQGDSAMLWRDDVAFIELDAPMHWRRRLAISREGLPEERDYEYYTVDQVDEHKGIIRKRECRSNFDTYVNPLAQRESSPNIPLMGCDFFASSSGSPILDSRDRIRAIASQPLSARVREWLRNSGMVMDEPLKPVIHTSNFACAPFLDNTWVSDERECAKEMSQEEVDKRRMEILNPDQLFASALGESRRSISASHFIHFETRLIPFESHFSPEVFPACFKHVNSWLGRYRKYTNYSIEITFTPAVYKKMVDEDGRVRSNVTELEKKSVRVYFGPKDLYNLKKSTVTVVDDSGKAIYRDIAACP